MAEIHNVEKIKQFLHEEKLLYTSTKFTSIIDDEIYNCEIENESKNCLDIYLI